MVLFPRKHLIRRFSRPQIVNGYTSTPYEEKVITADVQTLQNDSAMGPDGAEAVQKLQMFSNEEIFVENNELQQKADRLWFQNKWFEAKSSVLSENTPLRHWTSTFTECLDQDDSPEGGAGA